MTKQTMLQYIKDDLSAGIVNLELSNTLIERNIERALAYSSDFFTYTTFKTVDITNTTASGGYIDLDKLDDTGIPTIVDVYPTKRALTTGTGLLGIDSSMIIQGADFDKTINQYALLVSQISQLESILGRGAKVVGDKLYVDKFYNSVTIEYIPQVVKLENIFEGEWLQWILEYSVALSKRQLSASRGKHVVSSNPTSTNAATLLEEANAELTRLREKLELKGSVNVSR